MIRYTFEPEQLLDFVQLQQAWAVLNTLHDCGMFEDGETDQLIQYALNALSTKASTIMSMAEETVEEVAG